MHNSEPNIRPSLTVLITGLYDLWCCMSSAALAAHLESISFKLFLKDAQ